MTLRSRVLFFVGLCICAWALAVGIAALIWSISLCLNL